MRIFACQAYAMAYLDMEPGDSPVIQCPNPATHYACQPYI